MVPEVGQAEAKLSELQAGCRDGGLPTTQTPARLNAQKAFPGLEPEEAGSKGNGAPLMYGCEGFCSPL